MTPDQPTPPEKPAPAAPSPSPAPRKRRRWLRWTLGLLLALVLLLILVAGLGWYAISTEGGTRTLLARAGAMIPGELTIGAQSGPITGPLDLRDVHYRNDTM